MASSRLLFFLSTILILTVQVIAQQRLILESCFDGNYTNNSTSIYAYYVVIYKMSLFMLYTTFLSYVQSLSECSKENRFMVYFCRELKQQITDCHHYCCHNCCLCGINSLHLHHLFKKDEANGESRK